MDREAIEAEAYRRFPIENNNFQMLQASDCLWDGFVDGAEWMQEQKQAEIDELNNQLSVLTEQLDAAHVFCEGVKEHFINKACEWLSRQFVCDDTYVFTEFDFKQAMKGE